MDPNGLKYMNYFFLLTIATRHYLQKWHAAVPEIASDAKKGGSEFVKRMQGIHGMGD